MKLIGRVAIVTGAARGIGRGICDAFAAEGAALAIVDVDGPRALRVAAQLRGRGTPAIAVQADVSAPDDAERCIRDTVAEWGQIDILVNNAGIVTRAHVQDMSLDVWNTMIRTNLTSMFLMTRAVLPLMVAARYGRVINIASQLALRGEAELAHYCAAKAGVIGLTKACARELAEHTITVNAIAPGATEKEPGEDTDAHTATALQHIPLGRLATPAEIAGTAVLLASAEGAYYTGATLVVAGGDVMA